MAHESAKLLFARAGTHPERIEAVRAAMSLGMPIHEIREYLDWIDNLRPQSISPATEVDNGKEQKE